MQIDVETIKNNSVFSLTNRPERNGIHPAWWSGKRRIRLGYLSPACDGGKSVFVVDTLLHASSRQARFGPLLADAAISGAFAEPWSQAAAAVSQRIAVSDSSRCLN